MTDTNKITSEAREISIKRMRMRAWHRGIKEMDLILGGWADDHLAQADDAQLEFFEAVLAEDDHDLYQWVSGQVVAPVHYTAFMAVLAEQARQI
jgi:antitoxin CptB